MCGLAYQLLSCNVALRVHRALPRYRYFDQKFLLMEAMNKGVLEHQSKNLDFDDKIF
jgi:menaquinone-dependent protoporphyrinogen IX oxidase